MKNNNFAEPTTAPPVTKPGTEPTTAPPSTSPGTKPGNDPWKIPSPSVNPTPKA